MSVLSAQIMPEWSICLQCCDPGQIWTSRSGSGRELQEGSEGWKSQPTRRNDCTGAAFLKEKKIKDGGRESDSIPQICKRLLLTEQEKNCSPWWKAK